MTVKLQFPSSRFSLVIRFAIALLVILVSEMSSVSSTGNTGLADNHQRLSPEHEIQFDQPTDMEWPDNKFYLQAFLLSGGPKCRKT